MTNLQAPATALAASTLDPRPRRRSGLAAWLRRNRDPLILRHIASADPDGGPNPAGRPSLGELGAVIAEATLARRGGLMNAYVASAVDIALEAEALADGAPSPRVRTPVADLVAQVGEALQACAATAGARLACELDPLGPGVAVTDPGRLGKAVSHLALRALSSCGRGRWVRLSVVVGPDVTRIAVSAPADAAAAEIFDLCTLVRLLRAIGASLIAEPMPAGCLSLAIVLPAARAAAAASGRPGEARPEGRAA